MERLSKTCRVYKFLLMLFVISFVVTAYGYSQDQSHDGKDADGMSEHARDPYTIKLVTVGQGHELYYWFGHCGLIVRENATGRETFYDYGTFSFDQPGFYRNFAFGRLYYSLSVSPAKLAIRYMISINRAIRYQTLNLSPERERRVVDFLRENAKPENRVYLYHHYLDNCATRVRDVLDFALDGQLREATSQPGRLTFRGHTRRYLYRSFAADWFLMFLMGMNIDEPTTVWDEMFLPFEMERIVSDFAYRETDGSMVPLVADQDVVYESHGHRPPLDEWRAHWPFGLLIGLVLFLLIYVGRVAGRSLFGVALASDLLSGILFAFWGLLGTALLLIAAFTDHSLAYNNLNLLYVNPLTLVLSVMCFLTAILRCARHSSAITDEAVVKKRSERLRRRERLARLLAGVLFAFGLVAIGLKVFPALRQQNWLSICGVLPIYAGLVIPSGLVHSSRQEG